MANNNDTTIMSFYNKSSFLKVKSDGFSIDRLKLSFGNFDENKKLISNIDFWLDFAKGDAYVFLQDIISGKLYAEMEEEEKKRLKENPQNKYSQPVRKFQGGHSAKKAKEKEIRSDGAAHAKVLTIQKGLKYPVLFTMEEGPGRETQEGLIVPTYGRNPENKIQVTLTWDNIKALALAAQAHHNAYLTVQYANVERENRQARKKKSVQNKTTPSEA